MTPTDGSGQSTSQRTVQRLQNKLGRVQRRVQRVAHSFSSMRSRSIYLGGGLGALGREDEEPDGGGRGRHMQLHNTIVRALLVDEVMFAPSRLLKKSRRAVLLVTGADLVLVKMTRATSTAAAAAAAGVSAAAAAAAAAEAGSDGGTGSGGDDAQATVLAQHELNKMVKCQQVGSRLELEFIVTGSARFKVSAAALGFSSSDAASALPLTRDGSDRSAAHYQQQQDEAAGEPWGRYAAGSGPLDSTVAAASAAAAAGHRRSSSDPDAALSGPGPATLSGLQGTRDEELAATEAAAAGDASPDQSAAASSRQHSHRPVTHFSPSSSRGVHWHGSHRRSSSSGGSLAGTASLGGSATSRLRSTFSSSLSREEPGRSVSSSLMLGARLVVTEEGDYWVNTESFSLQFRDATMCQLAAVLLKSGRATMRVALDWLKQGLPFSPGFAVTHITELSSSRSGPEVLVAGPTAWGTDLQLPDSWAEAISAAALPEEEPLHSTLEVPDGPAAFKVHLATPAGLAEVTLVPELLARLAQYQHCSTHRGQLLAVPVKLTLPEQQQGQQQGQELAQPLAGQHAAGSVAAALHDCPDSSDQRACLAGDAAAGSLMTHAAGLAVAGAARSSIQPSASFQIAGTGSSEEDDELVDADGFGSEDDGGGLCAAGCEPLLADGAPSGSGDSDPSFQQLQQQQPPALRSGASFKRNQSFTHSLGVIEDNEHEQSCCSDSSEQGRTAAVQVARTRSGAAAGAPPAAADASGSTLSERHSPFAGPVAAATAATIAAAGTGAAPGNAAVGSSDQSFSSAPLQHGGGSSSSAALDTPKLSWRRSLTSLTTAKHMLKHQLIRRHGSRNTGLSRPGSQNSNSSMSSYAGSAVSTDANSATGGRLDSKLLRAAGREQSDSRAAEVSPPASSDTSNRGSSAALCADAGTTAAGERAPSICSDDAAPSSSAADHHQQPGQQLLFQQRHSGALSEHSSLDVSAAEAPASSPGFDTAAGLPQSGSSTSLGLQGGSSDQQQSQVAFVSEVYAVLHVELLAGDAAGSDREGQPQLTVLSASASAAAAAAAASGSPFVAAAAAPLTGDDWDAPAAAGEGSLGQVHSVVLLGSQHPRRNAPLTWQEQQWLSAAGVAAALLCGLALLLSGTATGPLLLLLAAAVNAASMLAAAKPAVARLLVRRAVKLLAGSRRGGLHKPPGSWAAAAKSHPAAEQPPAAGAPAAAGVAAGLAAGGLRLRLLGGGFVKEALGLLEEQITAFRHQQLQAAAETAASSVPAGAAAEAAGVAARAGGTAASPGADDALVLVSQPEPEWLTPDWRHRILIARPTTEERQRLAALVHTWRVQYDAERLLQRPPAHFAFFQQQLCLKLLHVTPQSHVVVLLKVAPLVAMSRVLAASGLTTCELTAHCGFLWGFMFERLAAAAHPGGRFVLVADMSNIKLGQAMGEGQIGARALGEVCNAYPERLVRCLILGTPTWFNMLYRLVRPHLAPSTRAKVQVCDGRAEAAAELAVCLGHELVPQEYGGPCSLSYDEYPAQQQLLKFVAQLTAAAC